MENSRSDVGRRVDRTEQTISKEFDWHETPPSVAVVRLLSVALNRDPTAIKPLGETVDPDALNRLLLSMDDSSKVEFTYHCLSVLLYGDGTAAVEPDGC